VSRAGARGQKRGQGEETSLEKCAERLGIVVQVRANRCIVFIRCEALPYCRPAGRLVVWTESS
jgi:hypothetical protein